MEDKDASHEQNVSFLNLYHREHQIELTRCVTSFAADSQQDIIVCLVLFTI